MSVFLYIKHCHTTQPVPKWNDQKCNFGGHLCPEEQDVNAGCAEDTGHRFRNRHMCRTGRRD